MTTPAPEELDAATIDLIFALRGSLADLGPLEFWSGRINTALETAAAGSQDAGQAITTCCHKLQIPAIHPSHAKAAVKVANVIDADYQAWASHVAHNVTYIAAMALAERDERKTTKKKTAPKKSAATEEIPF
ncbi:hypothetical protein V7G09_04830 [Cutibacterium avidum]|jgi:hypothetical protein|uniref:hypothetical protein n=1 Tax=Cutibacterium avidum TaxID=33010 RepID=UPI0020523B32|nr:hypothetical protein [Cutibacterium avidum]MDU5809327.1 hypothetical protein [Finegoldia magna]DAL65409.1 MAG TPA_asm: hypothetical protein [Caudoviricetes sp.]MCO6684752.1 hypothetical protein [Cutibacterium avidum]MCO6688313.1 hypothetical protein [Cutibacterium avidum]MDU5841451.1 hypothetical protein [Cutibacterium avidum]